MEPQFSIKTHPSFPMSLEDDPEFYWSASSFYMAFLTLLIPQSPRLGSFGYPEFQTLILLISSVEIPYAFNNPSK